MSKRALLTGNEAVAWGVVLSRAQVCPEYEITPATTVSEKLAEFIAKKILDAVYIPVESEHSGMAAAIGASYAGARAFTASSSHGIFLMHEMLHSASGMRRPIVMVDVNRAAGLPWNLLNDQIDSLSQRDTGWLQFYTESAQEALDTVIMAFKIAEHPEVQLPVMVVMEGFILSHTGEPVEIPDQEVVDGFLPPFRPAQKLDLDNPRSFGGFMLPIREYTKAKINAHQAMQRAKKVAKEVDEEFGKVFGRSYGIIEKFHWQSPQLAIVTAGPITSTVRHVLMGSKEYEDVGLLKVKMFRPFPDEEIRGALEGVEKVAVIDRDISLGNKGIFLTETESALYPLQDRPEVFGFITGLGGLDVTSQIIKEAIDYALKHRKSTKSIVWLPQGIEKEKPEAKYQDIELIRQQCGEELVYSGHTACQGCGVMVGLRHILKTLGRKTFAVVPASCSSTLTGVYPQTTLGVPLCHVNFETGASTASGIRAALKALRNTEVENVFVWAGDGGTYDIGFASLSGAAERGDDIIYVCANNEAYMNTGIQRSSATPWGAWTTTTPLPEPKRQAKKPMVEIMGAHHIPYAASASIAFPEDLEAKLKKAKSIKGGFKFIDLLCPCPTGWRFSPSFTVKLARLSVLTGAFPLFEIFDGEEYAINQPDVNKPLLPVKEYLEFQGRFSHLTDEDRKFIQDNVNHEWELLLKKAGCMVRTALI